MLSNIFRKGAMLAIFFRANLPVRISRAAPHRGAGRNCPENWPPGQCFDVRNFRERPKSTFRKCGIAHSTALPEIRRAASRYRRCYEPVRISRVAPHRGAGRNCPENWPPCQCFAARIFRRRAKSPTLKCGTAHSTSFPKVRRTASRYRRCYERNVGVKTAT